jgi:putative transcriptional regulator
MGKTKMKLKIANSVFELRTKNQLTQEQLGEAIEVTRATINAIEKGDYNPSLELAFRISLFFKKKIEDIFTVEGTYE